jgi:hypothetical protein
MYRIRSLGFYFIFSLLISLLVSCGNRAGKKITEIPLLSEERTEDDNSGDNTINALLIIPGNPRPGEDLRILATGGKNIRKAKIIISGAGGEFESYRSTAGDELPYWKIENFKGMPTGRYKASLVIGKETVRNLEFGISDEQSDSNSGVIWKTTRGWDSGIETIYSAWVNSLFSHCDEQASWPSLHEVTKDKERNFLYNYLGLGEDDPESGNKVIMEPDCADNPFYLRAYFSWKLGLPFGYHLSDRGYVGHSPHTGQWITNEASSSKSNCVQAFNSFLRSVMNGVHSGTARTALTDEKSDYYPVALDRESLRPGTVFADPYGHTLVLVSWMPQTRSKPGRLLAVDAQPDKTIAIKRFWKGNFLFNTSEVVGEPGFKAFRPIELKNGKLNPLPNEDLSASSGFVPFSLQQQKMESEAFYLAMDRIINPGKLDPETALADLVQALHEQLMVRVKSVANGEEYLQTHPGTIIPMPSNANGIFLAGGQWENYSTPNRDLRLLIAMDAVLDFPDRVAEHPEDYNISKLSSPEEIREKLNSLLREKISGLSINYKRSDGSVQELTMEEILRRKDAFEMAYNPNDGIEVRWGAPENSSERATCKRLAPAYQQKTMISVRTWFNKRLHPPT